MGHHQRPERRNTPVSVGRLSPGKPGAVRRDLGFASPFQAVPSHLLSRMKNYAGCPGDLLGRRFPRVGLGCLARYQPPVHLSAQEVSPHRAYVQWRGRARDFPFPHVCRTSARVIPPCGAYVQWREKRPPEEGFQGLLQEKIFFLHPTKVDAGRRNFGRCIACTLHGKCRSSSPWRRKKRYALTTMKVERGQNQKRRLAGNQPRCHSPASYPKAGHLS